MRKKLARAYVSTAVRSCFSEYLQAAREHIDIHMQILQLGTVQHLPG